MQELPGVVRTSLADPVYERTDAECVERAVSALGVIVPDTFLNFYRTYEGPFDSRSTGFELLDLCEQSVNVQSQTQLGRLHHSFPPRFLIITELLGGEVIVYDVESDSVSKVDFEGGEKDLLSGALVPRWKSFNEFLSDYFA